MIYDLTSVCASLYISSYHSSHIIYHTFFMGRIKVDLHDIYNNSKAIDKALQQAFEDAIDKKIKEVEIIPGKGSGQLRKKVERFLQMPHIKPLYHRIENDSKNFGRLFVYFKF